MLVVAILQVKSIIAWRHTGKKKCNAYGKGRINEALTEFEVAHVKWKEAWDGSTLDINCACHPLCRPNAWDSGHQIDPVG